MSKNKRGFLDIINDFTMKLAGPLTKFAQLKPIAAIQNGLVGCMSIIIVGSIFLILGVLGSPTIGTSGQPLLPFLAPYSDKFYHVNSLTMNFLALYASVTIAMAYAEELKMNLKNAAVLGLATFLLMTINVISDGSITVKPFSASGLFVCIVTSLLSVRIYKWFIDKKIVIKLPDSVPPNVGNAFSSLIPFLVIFTVAWGIRTLIGFDMVEWLEKLLMPVFNAADNIVAFTSKMTLTNVLWSAGLHGDNMLTAIVQPFETMWAAANAEAFATGVAATELPHIWTPSLGRLCGWTSTVWPLLILMFRSKVKYLRKFAWVCLPSAIFTIVEPVIFGLPLALNPFLIIPFILATIVSSVVTYGACLLGLVGRFFAVLPWATPPFLLGPLGTGDWKTIIIIALNVVIGFIIFYPFFKSFERVELEKEKKREAELENEVTV